MPVKPPSLNKGRPLFHLAQVDKIHVSPSTDFRAISLRPRGSPLLLLLHNMTPRRVTRVVPAEIVPGSTIGLDRGRRSDKLLDWVRVMPCSLIRRRCSLEAAYVLLHCHLFAMVTALAMHAEPVSTQDCLPHGCKSPNGEVLVTITAARSIQSGGKRDPRCFEFRVVLIARP